MFECHTVEFLILHDFAAIQIDKARLDERTSHAVYTPANDLRFHRVDVFGVCLADVRSLQSHHDAGPWYPTLLSEHIQPALTHVSKLVRLRCSSSPVVGNDALSRHSFVTAAVTQSRREHPAQKPHHQRGRFFSYALLTCFRFRDLQFMVALLQPGTEKSAFPRTSK